MCAQLLQLCLTLCNSMDCIANRAPLSTGCSWQEYWSGLPFSSPGDLPNPGIEPRYPTLQAGSIPSEPPGKPKLDITEHQLKQGLIHLRHKVMIPFCMGPTETYILVREEGLCIKKTNKQTSKHFNNHGDIPQQLQKALQNYRRPFHRPCRTGET